jgi:hypothetical protein
VAGVKRRAPVASSECKDRDILSQTEYIGGKK